MPINEYTTPGKIKMGIGTFLPKEVLYKRRYRWLMYIGPYNNPQGNSDQFFEKIEPVCVTIASRPNLTIEETELAFLNEKGYVAAKPTWEPLAVTFLDFQKPKGGGADEKVRAWIHRCYWFANPTSSGMMGDGGQYYKRTCAIGMYNGVGECMEVWTLYSCWIQSANWGDLDYAATENANIECSIRFDNADLDIKKAEGGPADAPHGGANVNSIA